MVKLLKHIFISLLLFAVTNTCMALNLKLIQSAVETIPIAVMSFAEHHDIAKIISEDLQNSGYFKVLNVNAPQQSSYGVHAVNYAYWAHQKMPNVVTGSISSSGRKYKVTFSLLDVSGRKILLDKFYKIPKSQLRSLAHHISDIIYQRLTGMPGIFATKLAYISGNNLMIADADGQNSKKLLTSNEPIMSPAWSPNSKKVAYVSFAHKKSAIYIQDIATGKRKRITNFSGINGAPAWSPDGKKLALVLTKSGYPKIYIFDLTTNKLQQATYGQSLDTEPSWAPDGKSLIFTSDHDRSVQIYQLDFTSNKIQRLTYQGNYNADASFTPDGKSIIMITQNKGKFNIAKQDLATGKIDMLTSSDLNESPSIAPNGRMIIYETICNNLRVLREISLDGKISLQLSSNKEELQNPAWSPFLY